MQPLCVSVTRPQACHYVPQPAWPIDGGCPRQQLQSGCILQPLCCVMVRVPRSLRRLGAQAPTGHIIISPSQRPCTLLEGTVKPHPSQALHHSNICLDLERCARAAMARLSACSVSARRDNMGWVMPCQRPGDICDCRASTVTRPMEMLRQNYDVVMPYLSLDSSLAVPSWCLGA